LSDCAISKGAGRIDIALADCDPDIDAATIYANVIGLERDGAPAESAATDKDRLFQGSRHGR
jgi:hypothetical protein